MSWTRRSGSRSSKPGSARQRTPESDRRYRAEIGIDIVTGVGAAFDDVLNLVDEDHADLLLPHHVEEQFGALAERSCMCERILEFRQKAANDGADRDKRFLEWERAGFFEALWKAGLAEYDGMAGIVWQWQSERRRGDDESTTRARSRWPEPDGPGKKGSKRHLLVDGRSVPLSLIVTGANVNDGKRLDKVLQAIVVKRERPPIRRNKHLCADAGYRFAARAVARQLAPAVR